MDFEYFFLPLFGAGAVATVIAFFRTRNTVDHQQPQFERASFHLRETLRSADRYRARLAAVNELVIMLMNSLAQYGTSRRTVALRSILDNVERTAFAAFNKAGSNKLVLIHEFYRLQNAELFQRHPQTGRWAWQEEAETLVGQIGADIISAWNVAAAAGVTTLPPRETVAAALRAADLPIRELSDIDPHAKLRVNASR